MFGAAFVVTDTLAFPLFSSITMPRRSVRVVLFDGEKESAGALLR